MASRRTRIKGIANIPQRRKTLNAPVNSDELVEAAQEPEQTDNVQPNLTLQREVDKRVKEPSPPLPITAAISHDSVEDVKSVENAKNVNDGEISTENENQKAYNIGIQRKITFDNDGRLSVPARRKFIKPAVSLGAINRKPREPEESKVIQRPAKSNKIIVLNEIITYPDQNQPVVIEGCKADSVEEHITQLKSPTSDPIRTPVNSIERKLSSNTTPVINSDIEYPIPPPSPSKINRSRIKAVPRLSQRNTSFSASESEDESRRNYRHRNDSVCSTTSGFQDSNSVVECLSPQKPKEFNSVIQRKCRRTEQSRKLAEARRDFYIKFGNKKPDRQKLTMIDLIFYNPTTNPMSHENKPKKEDDVKEDAKEESTTEEKVDDPAEKSGSDEENEIPAPQIKIGPQGEIVVDEQSLVIESKAVKKSREEMEKSKVVNGDFDTGYGVYKRAKRSKDWSKRETLKFYKALNTIGTDFTLMCELFPRRSRRELKMKFKKEERINKALIDRAIMQPCGFDFNDFKQEVDMEEKELVELEKQKEREQLLRKEEKKRKANLSLKNNNPAKMPKVEKKKKKQLDIMNVLDDTSDADESEMESIFDEDVEDDTQTKILETIQKPTRSGRVPKLLDRYKAPEPKEVTKVEPGSLIVVASTGTNGEPVYKVCMVTAEQNRQQIGEDMDSLSKALECKQNGYIQSLFTLSSTTISPESGDEVVEENLTIPAEENNFTIPAEENVTIPTEENVAVALEEVTVPEENVLNDVSGVDKT